MKTQKHIQLLAAIILLLAAILLLIATLTACGGGTSPAPTPDPASTPQSAASDPAVTAGPAPTTGTKPSNKSTTTGVATLPSPTVTRVHRTPTSGPPGTPPTEKPAPATATPVAPAPTATSTPLPPKPTAKSAPAPTTPPTAPPPQPQTGGVCDRDPSVRDAILAALGISSCAAVTDDLLTTVTTLDNVRLTPVDTYHFEGLTNLEHLTVTTNNYGIGLRSLQNLKTLHLTIELPQRGVTTSYSSTPSGLPRDLILDTLTMVLVPHPDGSSPFPHYDFLGPVLFYAARTLHIVDRQPGAYGNLYNTIPLTHWGDPYDPRTPNHLIIELNPDYFDNTFKSTFRTQGGPTKAYIGGSAVPRITLINGNPEVQVSLEDGAIQGDPRLPREIEIIGFSNITRDAFADIENLVSLNIDTDNNGQPWILVLQPGLNPTGTGFVIRDR